MGSSLFNHDFHEAVAMAEHDDLSRGRRRRGSVAIVPGIMYDSALGKKFVLKETI
jgi:hypothetical protein